MTIDLETTIDDFWAARLRGEYFPLAYHDRLTMDEAYRIQLALIDRRVAAGEFHIAGRSALPRRPFASSSNITNRCLLVFWKRGRAGMCSAPPN